MVNNIQGILSTVHQWYNGGTVLLSRVKNEVNNTFLTKGLTKSVIMTQKKVSSSHILQ